jgi:hypothetical protein
MAKWIKNDVDCVVMKKTVVPRRGLEPPPIANLIGAQKRT